MPMTETTLFERVEQRAFDLRMNMGEVCAAANVAHSTWSRAKSRGFIRPRTLARLESVLESFEAQRQAAEGLA